MSKNAKRELISWGLLIVVAVSMAWATRTFAIEPREVLQNSMVPTVLEHDQIVINKLAYAFGEPIRGDIIVFHPVAKGHSDEDLIKRVIGLPGEWIDIRGKEVYINGKLLVESGNKNNTDYTVDYLCDDESCKVGEQLAEDEYYVLGDNRDVSRDSRAFGPVPFEKIVGKVFLVFWPIDRFGTFK
ncbi:MAG TPA: signal peptidase I [Caldisericia bacterium]|nr:signal peptidase I [Caldisericia bacterium]HPF48527.1 signal peptidase I [Caldisericia bacterium]HPI84603.1 signal peptidase I [Caldisericia bacterium]HPQ92982.1 signal peptidase I [Caldisericia bacterium]HRV75184.1 signal peptidase I [Caldisericia bacterium]